MTTSTPAPLILDGVDDLVYRACAVLAATQLDLFTPLANGPLPANQIAQALGVEMIKLRPLLYVLVVVGLLTLENGRFANTAAADHYLVRGRPSYQGDRHTYWSDVWSAALCTADSIRTGQPMKKHDYASMPAAELEAFLQGLYPWTYEAGTWLVQKYDFSSYQKVLDAAGGSGALAIALTQALPRLQMTVIELPTVVPVTQRFVERAGATDRVQVEAADLLREPLLESFDAAILRAFIQTLSLEDAHHALHNINQMLKPGSTIYIWDRPLDDSRLTPPDLALFNLVFLNIYNDGQKYTVQEYRDLLTDTGFEGFELHNDRMMTAQKPV
jgi:3-hydroxy-5-methyl-1-naphthoate 3-O-methyltransferase